LIDTHCHLTFPDFAGHIQETLDEAASAGVMGAITISTTTLDCLRALEIARSHSNVWCSAGVHPLYSDQGPHEWENLRRVAADPRCVAWGELGLDHHYPEPARTTQHAVLHEQLEFIRRCRDEGGIDKPVVLHCREAFDDLIPILRASGLEGRRFVFHCFTGTVADMRKVLEFGAMASFTGVVTYRNAREVQEAARLAPLERIMVETDAPYLSPDPHRGERPCKPWMASVTARRLAEIRGEEWGRFEAAINENTSRFFGVSVQRPSRPSSG
jgi:TatD DNase family protein